MEIGEQATSPTPETTAKSRGSLRVVAHVAQWIERLPPEQKVVGPIPTVGAQEMLITTAIWSGEVVENLS